MDEHNGVEMSDKEVLLKVTSDHLNTGLRGVPVGTCRTSFVTPTEGVHYCGYPITELASFAPEDIIYLLFNKELPNAQQSEEIRAELSARATIPGDIETVLKTLPKIRPPNGLAQRRHPYVRYAGNNE